MFTIPGEQLIDVMCLLVKTGKHTVLIDTGCGIGLDPNAGKLMQNLQTAGISCTEIDTVILSHAHSDHIGGNTDAVCAPSFPNARYFIGKREWEFWTGSPDLTRYPRNIRQTMLNIIRKNLISIENKIVKVAGEDEILPGFHYIKAPGHSPGNMALRISSGNENLICIGDVFHSTGEIEQIDVFSAPLMTSDGKETRMKILSLAVKLKALVFACHFPFPGLGHILQKGETYTWQQKNSVDE